VENTGLVQSNSYSCGGIISKQILVFSGMLVSFLKNKFR
jgi:hypothetical protein